MWGLNRTRRSTRIGGSRAGSVAIFVVLILVYCRWVEKLDRAYDVHEDDKGSKQ